MELGCVLPWPQGIQGMVGVIPLGRQIETPILVVAVLDAAGVGCRGSGFCSIWSQQPVLSIGRHHVLQKERKYSS